MASTPPPPPGPPQQQPQQIIVQKGGNGLGTAGFVCAVIALVLSIIPIINLLSFPLALIGIILAGVGITRQPRGLAIAGVVCGVLAIIVAIGIYAAA